MALPLPPVTTSASHVQRVYLLLTLLTTLAASFIWGVNTLFLLDAGLNNTEAFAANAFFSVGMVIFEVPTGVVADTSGRRFSFMLGAATLLLATLLYLLMWQIEAPFIGWAFASILLGLGFTFFSGATEAWLVDCLGATGFTGNLETVFGRGQTIGGVAMLGGSVLGGVVAQMTNLGVPYLLRAVMLGVALLAAFFFMRDLGFSPKTGVSTRTAVKEIARGSIDGGLRNRPVRWMMLAAPFTGGVGFYAFYAMQPYLLELYGRPHGLQHRRTGGRDRGRRSDRRRPVGAHRASLLQPAHGRRVPGRRAAVAVPGGHRRGRLLSGPPGPDRFLPGCPAARRVGARRRHRRAHAPGLPQRHHRLGTTCHGAVVRLAHGIGRRDRRAAGAGACGGRVGLRGVVPRRGVISAMALPFVFLARRERAPSTPSTRTSQSPPDRGPSRAQGVLASVVGAGHHGDRGAQDGAVAGVRPWVRSSTGPRSMGGPMPADIVETKVKATTFMPAW